MEEHHSQTTPFDLSMPVLRQLVIPKILESLQRPLPVINGFILRWKKVTGLWCWGILLLSHGFHWKLLDYFPFALHFPVVYCIHSVVADLTLEERTCRNLLFNSCMLGDLGLARWSPPLLFSPFPPPRALITYNIKISEMFYELLEEQYISQVCHFLVIGYLLQCLSIVWQHCKLPLGRSEAKISSQEEAVLRYWYMATTLPHMFQFWQLASYAFFWIDWTCIL